MLSVTNHSRTGGEGKGGGVGGATTTQSMMEMPLTSLSDLLMNHRLLGVINPMQSDSEQGGLG